MDDHFPARVQFEIDHQAVTRVQRLEVWLALCVIGMFFGAMVGMASQEVKDSVAAEMTPSQLWSKLLFGAGCGTAAGLLFMSLIYLLLFHCIIRRRSERLSLRVDGPFLCVTEMKFQRTNRKIHFRSIVDYAIVDGPLLRFAGIRALRMNTLGGGVASSILVPGVKDCERVRDMLAEIDAAREQS